MSEAFPAPTVRFVSPSASGAPFAEDVRGVLDRIRDRVCAARSVDEILGILWDATLLILPRDRISMAFIEDDGARAVCRATRASYEEVKLVEGYGAGLAESTLQEVLASEQCRIIGDLEPYLEARPHSVSTRILLTEGVRSNLTLPLKVQDRAVGFLFFSSLSPNAYHEEHARILLAVLDRMAQAIEKAWIIKRLQDANEGYLAMLGFVSHELKSPLGGLIARGQSYVEGYLGEVDEVGGETVRKMIATASHLLGMVKDYLDLARLEGGELEADLSEAIDLREPIRTAADEVEAHAQRRESRLVLDLPEAPLSVRGDGDLLRIVFTNLLDNAVKYGFEKIEVRLRARAEDGHAVVSVRNPGVGFTEQEARKLFRRFTRLRQKGVEDRKGSGLGLYLTAWIVNKHGGRIEPRSEPGAWAEFIVRLPLADEAD